VTYISYRCFLGQSFIGNTLKKRREKVADFLRLTIAQGHLDLFILMKFQKVSTRLHIDIAKLPFLKILITERFVFFHCLHTKQNGYLNMHMIMWCKCSDKQSANCNTQCRYNLRSISSVTLSSPLWHYEGAQVQIIDPAQEQTMLAQGSENIWIVICKHSLIKTMNARHDMMQRIGPVQFLVFNNPLYIIIDNCNNTTGYLPIKVMATKTKI
jgi:hypothetical protein